MTSSRRRPSWAHHFFEAAVGGDPAKAVAYLTLVRARQRCARSPRGTRPRDSSRRRWTALDLGDPTPSPTARSCSSSLAARTGARRVPRRRATRCARPRAVPLRAASSGPTCWPVPRSTRGVGAFSGRGRRGAVGAARGGARGPRPQRQRAAGPRLLARLGVALYWSPDAERRLSLTEEAVAIRRAGLDDRATLAYALANRPGRRCRPPDRTEECVPESLTSCTASADSRWSSSELELPARVRQIGYLLELDDLAGADVALR